MRKDEFPIVKEYAKEQTNIVLDKVSEEIRHFMLEINPSSSESDYACNYILDVINKYKEGGADCESTSEVKETET